MEGKERKGKVKSEVGEKDEDNSGGGKMFCFFWLQGSSFGGMLLSVRYEYFRITVQVPVPFGSLTLEWEMKWIDYFAVREEERKEKKKKKPNTGG